jgi:transcriptional repressor NrdR
VAKRAGQKEPFDRVKLVSGVRAATKNRPVTEEQLDDLAQQVEEALRGEGAEVTSQQIGVAVLERLRALDDVAYLRFASVYKGFADIGDFQREVGLLTKTTEPKRKS